MKNTCRFFAIAAFMLALPAFSLQAQELRKFRFGLKIAPQISWFKTDFRDVPPGLSVQRDGVSVGFAWGPWMDIGLGNNETFALHTGFEINYSKGKFKGDLVPTAVFPFNRYEVEHKMRFIEVPLALKFRTKEIGYIRYFGLFGATIGARLRADSEYARFTTVGNTKVVETENNSAASINPMRGALLVGAGLEYSLGSNTALVGSLNFNNGFTNLLKNRSETVAKESAILNYLQLNLGVLF